MIEMPKRFESVLTRACLDKFKSTEELHFLLRLHSQKFYLAVRLDITYALETGGSDINYGT